MLWKNNQFFTDIPFPKVKDRPLIVAHPGAHMNYLASWNVMVDNEAPFVLVCDDLSRHDGISYPKEVQLYHRSMLQPVQEELAAVAWVDG